MQLFGKPNFREMPLRGNAPSTSASHPFDVRHIARLRKDAKPVFRGATLPFAAHSETHF